MSQTNVAFEGNLGADVEVSYTRAGKPVARFPVLVNRRRQDPQTGEWVNDEPTRHSCTAFGTLGQHIADSVGRGDRVLVMGSLVTDSWADRETGEKRTAQRILVDAAGPSLRWATATPQKAQAVGDADRVARDQTTTSEADTSAAPDVASTSQPQTETAGDVEREPSPTDNAAASVERARRAVHEVNQQTAEDRSDNIHNRTGDTTRATSSDDGLAY